MKGLKKYEPGTFFIVYKKLVSGGYGKALTHAEVRVYLSIVSHSYKKWFVFPSQKRIAEQSGVAERHVVRCIKILCLAGLISKASERRRGRWPANTYFIAEPRAWLSPSDIMSLRPGDKGHKKQVTSQQTNKTYLNKKKENKTLVAMRKTLAQQLRIDTS